MPATYDLNDDVGVVRLLIADNDTSDAVLQDEDIQALLDLRGNVHLAAASALRTIAASETMILKRIRLLDLDLNGPAEAAELRKNADALEAQANEAAVVEITD